MPLDCASCRPYACRTGRIDSAPAHCPMHGPFPAFEDLYGGADVLRLAYHAARVEADGYCRWTRMQEVAELVRRMGWRRVGIAHCRDMRREAALAGRYLHDQGLEVVLPDAAADCDPVGQAERLAAGVSEFNVIAGMCVGHDALFVRHSRAPVTSLVVRDLRLRHNPVAALYARKGYLSRALAARPSSTPAVRFAGWDDDRLDRIAREVRDAGMKRSDPPCRVEEVMDFARRAGVRHLGLVYCVGFRDEALQLHAVLTASGFTVSSSCCKTGSVPKDRLGIRDDEQVHPGRPEMICNALAQAELLEREGAEMALLLGQCVGHDSATMARCRVPVMPVVAKDRVLVHNTVAALYELEGDGAS